MIFLFKSISIWTFWSKSRNFEKINEFVGFMSGQHAALLIACLCVIGWNVTPIPVTSLKLLKSYTRLSLNHFAHMPLTNANSQSKR